TSPIPPIATRRTMRKRFSSRAPGAIRAPATAPSCTRSSVGRSARPLSLDASAPAGCPPSRLGRSPPTPPPPPSLPPHPPPPAPLIRGALGSHRNSFTVVSSGAKRHRFESCIARSRSPRDHKGLGGFLLLGSCHGPGGVAARLSLRRGRKARSASPQRPRISAFPLRSHPAFAAIQGANHEEARFQDDVRHRSLGWSRGDVGLGGSTAALRQADRSLEAGHPDPGERSCDGPQRAASGRRRGSAHASRRNL